MAQLKAVKEFQKGVVDAISGKKVTVAPTATLQSTVQAAAAAKVAAAAAAAAVARAPAAATGVGASSASASASASSSAASSSAASPPVATTAAPAELAAASPHDEDFTSSDLAVDYGEEDDEDAQMLVSGSAEEADRTAGGEKLAAPPVLKGEQQAAGAEEEDEQQQPSSGAAKLLSLASKLQGIVKKQGVQLRIDDPVERKKWTPAAKVCVMVGICVVGVCVCVWGPPDAVEIIALGCVIALGQSACHGADVLLSAISRTQAELSLDLRTKTLEWVGFVPDFCPPPADRAAQLKSVQSAFKFFWSNVAEVCRCPVTGVAG
jgi:hypothetical protein